MDVTKRALAVVEKMKIEQALKEADGNKGRAAELLQISYKMLLAQAQGAPARVGGVRPVDGVDRVELECRQFDRRV